MVRITVFYFGWIYPFNKEEVFMPDWLYNIYVDVYNRYVALYNRWVDWWNRDATEEPEEAFIPMEMQNE